MSSPDSYPMCYRDQSRLRRGNLAPSAQHMTENQHIENKKSLSLLNEGMESLCAMVNTDEGYGSVIFGINPDGKIIGVEGNLDTMQQTIRQNVSNHFSPELIISVALENISEKNIVRVSAKRIIGVPLYSYKGRFWLREGSTNRYLVIDEIDSFRKRRQRDNYNGPWKCNKCNCINGQITSIEITNLGVKKTYKCSCGGEFFPI